MVIKIALALFMCLTTYLCYVNMRLWELNRGLMETIAEMSVQVEQVFQKIIAYENTYGNLPK